MIGAGLKYAVPGMLLLAAGCGLKGPLYLPDRQKEEVVAPAPVEAPAKRQATPIPAPQSQKKDRATSETPANDTESPVSPPDADRPATTAPAPPPGL